MGCGCDLNKSSSFRTIKLAGYFAKELFFSFAAGIAPEGATSFKHPGLLYFFIDRLKVYLRDRGARYDLIDAALGAHPHP